MDCAPGRPTATSFCVNCSGQINVMSSGNVCKGLSQMGVRDYFDEFNFMETFLWYENVFRFHGNEIQNYVLNCFM